MVDGGTLFDGDVGGTEVFLSVTCSDEHGLEISGSDYGTAPRSFFGSSEYEYWRSVKPEYTDRVFFTLLKEMGNEWEPYSNERLVELVRERFGGTHQAEKNFRLWCENHFIPTEFFSWVSGS